MFAYANCDSAVDASVPGVNLYENEKDLLLEIELPGRKRNDVDVEVRQNQLHISAKDAVTEREGFHASYSERRRGAFKRSFKLGTDLEAEKIQAQFENGLLVLTIPKHEQAAARKIEIH